MEIFKLSPYTLALFFTAVIKSGFLVSSTKLNFEIIIIGNFIDIIILFLFTKNNFSDLGAKAFVYILCLSCFIYCTAPLAFYIFAPRFAAFYNDTLFYSSLFNSTFLSWTYFWVMIYFNRSAVQRLQTNIDLFSVNFQANSFQAISVTLVGFVLLLIYVENYFSSGASTAVLNSSRFEITKTVETGRIWLIQYAMSAYFIWLVCYFFCSNQRTQNLYFTVICLNAFISITYLYFYFQLGNRREVVAPVLFFILLRYIKNNKIDLFPVLGALAALVWLGITRVSAVQNSSIFFDDALFAGLGEFLLISFPLNLYIESGTYDFRFGGTVFQSIAAGTPLISDAIKPLSLANEFVEIFSRSGIGYGFSPMAESYLNFGLVGAVIGPFALITTIWSVSKINFPYRGFAMLVLASLSFDIFRGESGSLFWQFIVIFGLLAIFSFDWRIGSRIPVRHLVNDSGSTENPIETRAK